MVYIIKRLHPSHLGMYFVLCCSGTSGLTGSYWGQQSAASACHHQQHGGRELDKVEQKTEARGSGVRGASRPQSMTCNTKEQRQRVQWKDCNSEFSTRLCASRWWLQHLMHQCLWTSRGADFATLHSCIIVHWALSSLAFARTYICAFHAKFTLCMCTPSNIMCM